MKQLFAAHPDAGAGTSARQQALDQVEMNIKWLESREQSLRFALNAVHPS